MLRYLIKTLLQMNLFTDILRDSNGTDLLYNLSIPTFNSSLLDWANFTGFNGQYTHAVFHQGRVQSQECQDVKGGQKCIKLFFKLTVKNMDTEVHDLPFQSVLPDFFFLQTFTGSTLTLWCTCYDKQNSSLLRFLSILYCPQHSLQIIL